MHIFDWEEWASYFGLALNEFHLPYNFGLLGVSWTAEAVAGLIDEIESVVPDGAWPNWVLGNHDEARIASRLGPEHARAAMTLLLTLRGTPTIYYGDELGMIDADVPPELRQDPWGLQVAEIEASRDPQRSPMLWNTGPNGGFTQPEVQPWLPLIDWNRYCVEAHIDDPGSMLNLTRRLLQLRRERPSLHAGTIEIVPGAPHGCLVFLRQAGDERTLVAVSFSDEAVDLDLGENGRARTVLLSSIDHSRPGASIVRLSLAAHEAAIIDIT
jgi:alpha-glucosidase